MEKRLIDADVLKKEMVTDLANTTRMREMHKGDMAVSVLNKIDESPTIEAEPVRHGALISTGYDEIYCEWGTCSKCGADNMISNKRCCECGAYFVKKDAGK